MVTYNTVREREIRVTFDVQLAFSLPNVGEGSHLTKRFIAS